MGLGVELRVEVLIGGALQLREDLPGGGVTGSGSAGGGLLPAGRRKRLIGRLRRLRLPQEKELVPDTRQLRPQIGGQTDARQRQNQKEQNGKPDAPPPRGPLAAGGQSAQSNALRSLLRRFPLRANELFHTPHRFHDQYF
jgi:hypothetical protein